MQAGDFSQWRTSAVKQLFSDDPHQYWLCQLAGKIGGSGLEPLIRIFQIGQLLEDEPEHDPETLAELGLELQQLSGICHACVGEGGHQDESDWWPCSNCCGSGQVPVDLKSGMEADDDE